MLETRQGLPRWLWVAVAAIGAIALVFALGGCRPTPERAPDRSDSLDVAPGDTIPTGADSGEAEGETEPLEADAAPLEELEASDTVISAADSAARRRRSTLPPGLAVGLNKWPADKWCAGPLTGTVAAFHPKIAAGVIRKAEFCGIKIIGAMPRAAVTQDGTNKGYFVLSKGKAACDLLATNLGSLVQSRNLDGIMATDEPFSHSWQQPAKPSDMAEYARYCKAKLPGVPIMFRVTANHEGVKSLPASEWSGVSHWWAQWNRRRGPKSITNMVEKQRVWYDAELAAARRVGGSLVMGLNYRDCGGANTGITCTPTELRNHAKVAISHPSNCHFPAWWYEDGLWNNSANRAAWNDVVAMGRARGATSCRR